jgi:cell division protein FtsB
MDLEDHEKTAHQQVKEALWTYSGWVAILLICIFAGLFIGHQLWGDAVALRRRVEALDAQVQLLKTEREDLSTRVAKLTEERDDCRKAPPSAAAGTRAGALPASRSTVKR